MFSRIRAIKLFSIPLKNIRYNKPIYFIRNFGIIDSIKNSVTDKLEKSNLEKQGIAIYGNN